MSQPPPHPHNLNFRPPFPPSGFPPNPNLPAPPRFLPPQGSMPAPTPPSSLPAHHLPPSGYRPHGLPPSGLPPSGIPPPGLPSKAIPPGIAPAAMHLPPHARPFPPAGGPGFPPAGFPTQMRPPTGQIPPTAFPPSTPPSSSQPHTFTTPTPTPTSTPTVTPTPASIPVSTPASVSTVHPAPTLPLQESADAHQAQHRRRLYPEEITKAYAAPAASQPQPQPAVYTYSPQPGVPTQHLSQGYSPHPATQPQPQPQPQGLVNQLGNLNLGSPNSAVNLMNPLNLNEVNWAPRVSLPGDAQVTPSPYANPSPLWKACSLNVFPQTQALLSKTKLPLGVVVSPFRPQADDDKIPVISSSISRCRRCRTYLNPFVTLLERGLHWKCNMCATVNDFPKDFVPENPNQPFNILSRPEFNYGVVEFIASSDFLVRPPQPPVYLFIIDVTYTAIASGMLATAVRAIKEALDTIPNIDRRTKIGFITVDSTLHFYNLNASLSQPQMLVVSELEDAFLPIPDDLLAHLYDSRAAVESLLDRLPDMFKSSQSTSNALGAALTAAQKLISPIGGKVLVFQSSLPNIGPGALAKREDVTALGTPKEDALLQPASAFYKSFAVECSRVYIGVDLFLFSGQYADIATLDCLPHFTGGSLFHYFGFNASRSEDSFKFSRDLSRHLSHPFGLEAVMRVRASKGISFSAFHGNFFLRSTDLLALPNVNPDNSYAIQMTLDENQTSPIASLQTALLYTTSYGERRIRVLNLALPVSNDVGAIFAGVNAPAMANLLSKMAVERAVTAKLEDARDALVNKVIEILQVYRSIFSSNSSASPLLVHDSLKIFPLMILSLIKNESFRAGAKTLSDQRAFAMSILRSLPMDLSNIVIIPRLYAIHQLSSEHGRVGENGELIMPPLHRLSAEALDRQGVYLLDDGLSLFLFVMVASPPGLIQQLFGAPSINEIPTGRVALPILETPISEQVNNILGKIRESRPSYPLLHVIKENGDPLLQQLFFVRLIEDRTDQVAMSYQQFLLFLKEKSSS